MNQELPGVQSESDMSVYINMHLICHHVYVYRIFMYSKCIYPYTVCVPTLVFDVLKGTMSYRDPNIEYRF